jgi:hypothetical protein
MYLALFEWVMIFEYAKFIWYCIFPNYFRKWNFTMSVQLEMNKKLLFILSFIIIISWGLLIHVYSLRLKDTVKPVLRGHLCDKEKVVLYDNFSSYEKKLWQDKKMANFWYKKLLNRGDHMNRFDLIEVTTWAAFT